MLMTVDWDASFKTVTKLEIIKSKFEIILYSPVSFSPIIVVDVEMLLFGADVVVEVFGRTVVADT